MPKDIKGAKQLEEFLFDLPKETWRKIAGFKCVNCGKSASHFYYNEYICCQCHKGSEGNYFSEEDTNFAHEKVFEERRAANKYED